jgi:hypothetical protein
MLTDASPTTYTYDQAASILAHLGFELAPHGGGSHRKWRIRTSTGNPVVIGLVDKGSGALKAYLVRDMVQQLQGNGLIPEDLTPE